jgi:hypothetical protein
MDQPPHLADAFGAADRRLAMMEDLDRLLSACRDGRTGLALTDSIAVADVHGSSSRALT